MAFSLYSATIPPFLQILGSVAQLVEKAEAYCEAQGLPADELIGARLAPDMLPFAYQVKSTAEHSIGAIEAVRRGVFSPSLAAPPDSFAGLRDKLDSARAALAAIDSSEVDSFVGRDMRFEFKDFRLDFTAEGFLTSFSLPNFYFHATTAYDVLRMKGLPIGKRDFMGQMSLKA
jgi:hypothetical protein